MTAIAPSDAALLTFEAKVQEPRSMRAILLLRLPEGRAEQANPLSLRVCTSTTPLDEIGAVMDGPSPER